MKFKKLQKKVSFIYKKKLPGNLSKEQMLKIKGGDNPTDKPSVEVTCTVTVLPTVSAIN